jgi:hypothetical protein
LSCSCHQGPYVSSANEHLFSNSIRVLCNANKSEGFNPSKDVSLPEINLRTDAVGRQVGGPSASRRPILAFFAGGNHGPVRPVLLAHWNGSKDPGVQVSEYLPRGVSYTDTMRRARFCLCPGEYEVASPRLAEAVYLECVPVVVDDGDYALPFADVLNWDAFSLRVRVADVPRIKELLSAVRAAAAPGQDGAPPLHGPRRAAAALRRLPHGPALGLAPPAQLPGSVAG